MARNKRVANEENALRSAIAADHKRIDRDLSQITRTVKRVEKLRKRLSRNSARLDTLLDETVNLIAD